MIEVLTERGYERSRFTDVATASGMAISTLQSYFGSREDMLIEALFRASDQEAEGLRAVAEARPEPWERLVALVERSLSTPTAARRMVMEFWCASMHDEELRSKTVEFTGRYREPFLAAVVDGERAGAFAPRNDAEEVVDVLIVTLGGAIVPDVLAHRGPTRETLQRVILHQLAAALGVEIA